MKNITLTMNEALVLIAEGMTMNNVKTLANKLRNADAPAPVIHPSNAAYHDALKQVEILKQNLKSLNQQVYDYERALEKAKAQSKTWEQSYHDAMANLDKAKQTESTLRQQIRDLENDAKQDDESMKYFRKWVEELRTLLECDEGLTSAVIMSEAIEHIKNHNQTVEALNKGTLHLIKANDVISAVKTAYDHEGWTQHKAICEIADTVEAYYRGN